MSTRVKPFKPAWAVQELISSLNSHRKVRPVVTPSGHRARGKFPSLKTLNARFESLVEEDFLRILEVAPSVEELKTHPLVLRLKSPEPNGRPIHYTPDVLVRLPHTLTLVEVKGDWLLKLPTSRANLRRSLLAARMHDLPLALLSESDARPPGLQEELKLLLRDRPARNRRLSSIKPAEWDPTSEVAPTADMLRRWREAQKACDDLLDRVMSRDPDAVIESLAD